MDESGDVVIAYIVPNAQKSDGTNSIELQPDSRSTSYLQKKIKHLYFILQNINLVNGKNTYRVKQGGTFYLKCKRTLFGK